jgi:hypothetical protein
MHMGNGKSVVSALALLLMMLVGSSAHAALVSYSTAATFNALPNTITFGTAPNTLTLNFLPTTSTVDANPSTFGSLGELQTVVAGNGATIPAATPFELTITQTVPSGGQGTLTGTLSGTITQNSSTGSISMTLSSTNIGGVNYALVNNPLVLVPPSSNNGITSIQAEIIIPEPTSLGLVAGMGMVILGLRRR